MLMYARTWLNILSCINWLVALIAVNIRQCDTEASISMLTFPLVWIFTWRKAALIACNIEDISLTISTIYFQSLQSKYRPVPFDRLVIIIKFPVNELSSAAVSTLILPGKPSFLSLHQLTLRGLSCGSTVVSGRSCRNIGLSSFLERHDISLVLHTTATDIWISDFGWHGASFCQLATVYEALVWKSPPNAI